MKVSILEKGREAEHRYPGIILNISTGFEGMSISLFCCCRFRVHGISIHEHGSEESLHPGTEVVL